MIVRELHKRWRKVASSVTVVVLAFILAPIRSEAIAGSFLLEFSGSDFFLLVDGNGDGPGPGDCKYQIFIDSSDPFSFPNIRIEAVQDLDTPLNLCSGSYFGDLFLGSDASSDFAETDLDTTDMPGGMTQIPSSPAAGLRYYPPIEVELIEEFNGPPDGFPMAFNQVSITDATDRQLFFMNVCDEGGAALQITAGSGLTVLLQLTAFPDAMNPTHLKMASLPFELASPNLGTLVTRDAYFPINNGRFTANVEGSGDLLIDNPLDALAPCPARRGAPTLSNWSLAGAALALLIIGTWILRRRRGFYNLLSF